MYTIPHYTRLVSCRYFILVTIILLLVDNIANSLWSVRIYLEPCEQFVAPSWQLFFLGSRCHITPPEVRRRAVLLIFREYSKVTSAPNLAGSSAVCKPTQVRDTALKDLISIKWKCSFRQKRTGTCSAGRTGL